DGSMGWAVSWLDQMTANAVQPSLAVYQEVLDGYINAGSKRAVSWLGRMRADGVWTGESYDGPLCGLLRGGSLKWGDAWLRGLLAERVQLSAASFDSIVDACLQGKRGDMAGQWVKRRRA
ncbi:unnamed protein product, partial [Prorocentrum cordatum]